MGVKKGRALFMGVFAAPIVGVWLFGSASAQSIEDICFRHKVRGTIAIRKGCVRLKGRHDAFFRYECLDEKSGRLEPFDPGDKWEELDKDAPGCAPISPGGPENPEIPEPPPVPKSMDCPPPPSPMEGFENEPETE